jgi:hypothetical protein
MLDDKMEELLQWLSPFKVGLSPALAKSLHRAQHAKSGWCGENDVEQANQNVDTNQFLVDGLV